MAWIELHQSVFRHPKTIKASARLKLSRPQLVGHLISLWCWALDSVNERGGPMTKDEVIEGARWTGRKDRFVNALVDAGFLDRRRNGGLFIHNWSRYSEKLQRNRAETRERVRRFREKRRSNDELADSNRGRVTRYSNAVVTPTDRPYRPTDRTDHDDQPLGTNSSRAQGSARARQGHHQEDKRDDDETTRHRPQPGTLPL